MDLNPFFSEIMLWRCSNCALDSPLNAAALPPVAVYHIIEDRFPSLNAAER